MVSERDESVYEFGPFRLAADVRRLTREGRPVPLTARLFDILLLLVRRKGEVLSKEDILLEVWGDQIVEENNVAVALNALRKTLGETHGRRDYIETVPKRGYRFVAKVSEPGGKGAERGEASRSIAVLPLTVEGGEPGLEYLSDGIAETLIGSLSQLPGLRVMAFLTSGRYKGRADNVLGAGREMGVDAVLAGRLRKSGEALSIAVELVDVADGARIWGAQYSRGLADARLLQEEIGRAVLDNLRLTLTDGESRRLSRRYTRNAEAYHFYLKGRYFAGMRTADGIRKGIQCFEEAIRIDRDYALAYAGLADSHHALVTWNVLPPQSQYPVARRAALRALEIDDSLSEAHASLAYVEFHTWQWQSAAQSFARAVELNPNNDRAFRWYSSYLSAMGRVREGLLMCERALRLDPLSPHTRTQLGRHLYYARDYDRAIDQCREVLDVNPDWPDAHAVLGLTYLQKGMVEEAAAAFRRTNRLLPDDPETLMLVGCGHAAAGRHKEALEVLGRLKRFSARRYASPHLMAWMYSTLRDKDRAFEWLEKAYEYRSYSLAHLKISPLFDALRSDPRFDALLRRMGLG